MKTEIEFGELPSGKSGEIHYIPRLGMTVGVNPKGDCYPVEFMSNKDGSFTFNSCGSPVASIATKKGELLMTMSGIHLPMPKKGVEKIIPWTEPKLIAQTIGEFAYKDPVFQKAIRFVPGSLATVIKPCKTGREALEILTDVPVILECSKEFIPAVVETVNNSAACIDQARQTRDNCKANCSGFFAFACRAGCDIAYGARIIWCVANAIVEIIVEAARTVVTCVLKRGYVHTNTPQSGDVILFEADTLVGHGIDLATCGYGYSHAALVCGEELIEAVETGVEVNPLSSIGSRDHGVIRLGLNQRQIEDLCRCVRSQSDEKYDFLEALTFGTIDDPGREICTMLIVHCLEEIGIDRDELGLGGFVSPNDFARTFDLPHGHLV